MCNSNFYWLMLSHDSRKISSLVDWSYYATLQTSSVVGLSCHMSLQKAVHWLIELPCDYKNPVRWLVYTVTCLEKKFVVGCTCLVSLHIKIEHRFKVFLLSWWVARVTVLGDIFLKQYRWKCIDNTFEVGLRLLEY